MPQRNPYIDKSLKWCDFSTTKGENRKKTKLLGFSGIQTINRNFDIYSGEEFAHKREAFRTSNNGVYRPDEVFSALELESVQSGEASTGKIHAVYRRYEQS
jgi:hypothetical protein